MIQLLRFYAYICLMKNNNNKKKFSMLVEFHFRPIFIQELKHAFLLHFNFLKIHANKLNFCTTVTGGH